MTQCESGHIIKFTQRLFSRQSTGKLLVLVLALCVLFTGCAKADTLPNVSETPDVPETPDIPASPGQPQSGPNMARLLKMFMDLVIDSTGYSNRHLRSRHRRPSLSLIMAGLPSTREITEPGLST